VLRLQGIGSFLVTLLRRGREHFASLLRTTPSYSLVIEDDKDFAGWTGVDRIEGTDGVQLGWYLCSNRGRGYATEATGSCSACLLRAPQSLEMGDR
jgi:hypothetical protein